MSLIGRLAVIIDARSELYGAAGEVSGFDGQNYLILVEGKRRSFRRNQFIIPR